MRRGLETTAASLGTSGFAVNMLYQGLDQQCRDSSRGNGVVFVLFWLAACGGQAGLG